MPSSSTAPLVIGPGACPDEQSAPWIWTSLSRAAASADVRLLDSARLGWSAIVGQLRRKAADGETFRLHELDPVSSPISDLHKLAARTSFHCDTLAPLLGPDRAAAARWESSLYARLAMGAVCCTFSRLVEEFMRLAWGVPPSQVRLAPPPPLGLVSLCQRPTRDALVLIDRIDAETLQSGLTTLSAAGVSATLAPVEDPAAVRAIIASASPPALAPAQISLARPRTTEDWFRLIASCSVVFDARTVDGWSGVVAHSADMGAPVIERTRDPMEDAERIRNALRHSVGAPRAAAVAPRWTETLKCWFDD